MASDASFAQFVADQVSGAGTITTRFMFGEYALYCNEKVVGLICDNKLFVKPTDGGRAFIGTPVEAPAYTGAKPSFLIEEQLEDAKWLTELIRITETEVALPVKKSTKKGKEQASHDSAPGAKPVAAINATATPKATAKKSSKKVVPKSPQKQTKKPAGPATKSVNKAVKKTAPQRTKKSIGKVRKSVKKVAKKPLKRTVKPGKKAGRK